VSGLNNTTITKIENGWGKSYGRIIVSRGQIHQWRMQVTIAGQAVPHVVIGISSEMEFGGSFYALSSGYGMYILDGGLFHASGHKDYNNKQFRSGDIIDMRLDLSQGENGILFFGENESYDSFGVAFNHIDITKKYRLAVWCWHKDFSVSVLSHSFTSVA